MEGREYREHWEEAHLKEYLKLINYKDPRRNMKIKIIEAR